MGGQTATSDLTAVADAVQAHLADAHAFHQARMLSDAIRLYRDALLLEPDNIAGLHDLGILYHQLGLHTAALEYIDRALKVSPDWATAHKNRGIVCIALGLDDAALASLHRAVACDAADASAYAALGGLLCKLKRYEDALAALDAAIELGARDVRVFNNHGVALSGLKRFELALRSFDQALQLAADDVEVLTNRAIVLQPLGRLDEALADVDRATSICPGDISLQWHRKQILDLLGRFDEELACVLGLCDRSPDIAPAHIDLGVALARLARYEEALAHFDRAIELEPHNVNAHANRGSALLALGELKEGWKEHEWRWKTKWFAGLTRGFFQPQWTGDNNISDKTILLYAEQGLGDTLQFCRFVPLVTDRAQVIFEVPSELRSLMHTLRGKGRLIAYGDELPPFDLHCPLMSLPYALDTTLATLPSDVPYLAADQEQAMEWKARVALLPGLHVGLVWAGNPRLSEIDLFAIDRRRSIDLQQLAPLGAVAGVSFISLQKGNAAAQAAHPPAGLVIHDWTDELRDFADTAALIEALDLVISVDTAVVHLAGALGQRVWLLNRFDSCWRWLANRDDSPWYPTLRQFRQTAPGDWASVVRRVCAELRVLAG